MITKEDLVEVSFDGLNKMYSELNTLLFKQEEAYLRELNAFKTLKSVMSCYQAEIERRVKETELFD